MTQLKTKKVRAARWVLLALVLAAGPVLAQAVTTFDAQKKKTSSEADTVAPVAAPVTPAPVAAPSALAPVAPQIAPSPSYNQPASSLSQDIVRYPSPFRQQRDKRAAQYAAEDAALSKSLPPTSRTRENLEQIVKDLRAAGLTDDDVKNILELDGWSAEDVKTGLSLR